ncbi:DUF485 domain-containing protein [Patulibacter defluvii]|uniref:DUF485 domain-containing protein n=1 Tax=Patulibacter defluvii TaxID=3095358 RepID=UPI002A7561EA|nr:DUF485 domain-containing protein [Patulibacter sp. DM4]
MSTPVPPDEPTWEQVEASPEFQELVVRKRRWVLPATVFFLSWYLLFILLAGYASDFMGSEFLVDGLTVGYVFALSQFAMTFGLALAYVRRSREVFDPLREQALARAAGAETPSSAAVAADARRAPAATTIPAGGPR